MRLLVASFTVLTFAMALILVMRLGDRHFQGGQTSAAFPIVSATLIAFAVWTIGFIAVAANIPSGIGPVQYSGDRLFATYIFDLRVATILWMFAAPALATIMAIAFRGVGRPLRIEWLLARTMSYSIAWIVIFANPWFVPAV